MSAAAAATFAQWIPAIASAIGVGGSVLQTGMTNKRARAAQKRAHEYALDEMAQSFEYNKQAFDLENSYNTPLAQRERMKDAGLNPNFVDSTGAVAQMDSSVNGNAPAGGYSEVDLGLDRLVTLANLALQKKKTDSDIQVNDSVILANEAKATSDYASASQSEAQTQNIYEGVIPLAHAQIADISNQILNRDKQLDISAKQLEQVVRRTSAEISKMTSECETMEQLRMVVAAKLPYELANMDAQTTNIYVDSMCKEILANNDKLRVRIEQQNADANTRNSFANQMNANTNQMNANTLRQYYQDMVKVANRSLDIQEDLNSHLSRVYDSQADVYDADNIGRTLANYIVARQLQTGYTEEFYTNTLLALKADIRLKMSQERVNGAQAAKIAYECYSDFCDKLFSVAKPFLGSGLPEGTSPVTLGSVIPIP